MVNNELLLDLYSKDKQTLFDISKQVNQFFEETRHPWEKLNNLILNCIKPVHFSRIIQQLPVPEKYHRLSLSPSDSPIDVVLFVLKCEEKKGGIALIHSYDNHEPNAIIYDEAIIDNPIRPEAGHILRCLGRRSAERSRVGRRSRRWRDWHR